MKYKKGVYTLEEATEKRRQQNGHEFDLLPPVGCVSPYPPSFCDDVFGELSFLSFTAS